MAMTISQLARQGGVGVETIRFYQRKGLMDDPRPASIPGSVGRKHYGTDDKRRLAFIRSAKNAGFTLDEIGQLLKLDRTDDREEVRSMASARINALDMQIGNLTKARSALKRLASECANGEEGACPIIEAFES